jgi:hypothetical protein
MFELDSYNSLIFTAADLKEIYEPIITKYGFEYDKGLDRDKKGLVWTKVYEGDEYCMALWPLMVVRETDMSPLSDEEFNEAKFFSTSLWLEDRGNQGFMVGADPTEFEDGSGDEVETLIEYMREAQKEVNKVLEECREQLAAELTKIRNKLIKEN